jgi:putative Mn2+ efflux pump MntP
MTPRPEAGLTLPMLLLIAAGLAMDAFAVSVAYGMSFRRRDHRSAAKLSGAFGVFQAGMPIIGWTCGTGLRRFIDTYDHWVAFGLLLLVGGKMVLQALRERTNPSAMAVLPTDTRTVLLLAVATSIDAMAVGLSLSLLGVRLLGPVLVIGGVTLVVSYTGVVLGYEFRSLLGERWHRGVLVGGGLVLVGIGLQIVCEHLGLLSWLG